MIGTDKLSPGTPQLSSSRPKGVKFKFVVKNVGLFQEFPSDIGSKDKEAALTCKLGIWAHTI